MQLWFCSHFKLRKTVKILLETLQGGKSLQYTFEESHIKKHVHMHVRI